MTRQYVGREFVLASSVWTSDFFGSQTERFVDARPFDILALTRQSGEAVAVSVASGEIVPAGTPVKVKDIVFPTTSSIVINEGENRQAPNAHPWIVVERTDKPAQPMIMVLPKDLGTEEGFVAEMQKRLASQQWLTSWLSNTDPSQIAKVFQKQVEPGMSRAAMMAALGEPKNAAAEQEAGGLDFVADYGDLQVTVTGSMISKVVSLKAEAEKARLEAEQKAAIARAEAEAKARADAELQAKLAAERELEAKKRAIEDEKRRKEEELQARLAAAKAAKEEAEREKQRRIAEAKTATAVAKAEKEAAEARKRADIQAAKAEAEAAEARKKADIEAARAEAEAAKARAAAEVAAAKAEAEAAAARRQLEEKVAVAEREADAARRRANLETQAANDRRAQAQAQAQAQQAAATQPAPAPQGPRKVGVKLAALTKESAFDLKLTQLDGAHVVATTAGGAAETAGVRAQDVVLAVDGKTVRKPEDFTMLVGATPRDLSIKLSVWRDGAKATVVIPSETGPASVPAARGGAPAASGTKALTQPKPAAPQTAAAEPGSQNLMPKRRSGETEQGGLR